MRLAIIYSRATTGMIAPLVTVEVHISGGIPGLNIVGLPETAVRESKDRVRSALMNTGFEFPARRITVNLAPADLPKEGGRFDLPIALGILAASFQISRTHLEQFEFIGELALSGELRMVRGVLPVVLGVSSVNRQLIVPEMNAHEAALVKQENIFYAKHLLEVCAHLKGEQSLPLCHTKSITLEERILPDLSEVRGQTQAKRALEIAAAGRHSLLFVGPPGTGKTMLASRLPSLLPGLDEQQSLEVASVASISRGGFNPAEWQQMPYRAPHHGCSSAALVGGGRPPRPGEISLAHHGILFLDELPEFDRNVLESLREPLESGHVTISRAAHQAVFPAQFQLIAAMNPCPCGYLGVVPERCRCTISQIKRYLSRLSGPLLDRIDMQVEVPGLPPGFLLQEEISESSATVRDRVLACREIQLQRQGKCNHDIAAKEVKRFCPMEAAASQVLEKAAEHFQLSVRVCHRVIRIARTIADIEKHSILQVEHISEALGYRYLDRPGRLKEN
ncbi:MAG: YifB family Mg chelatase-like AAA ATPase [Gammaproteobacteria bacterium]|nr:YifB family Mg chelatase-like AAA ATPase [Gammaproteobacteria bacterium]